MAIPVESKQSYEARLVFNSIPYWLSIVLLFMAVPIGAETVTVRSGNGTVGGRDNFDTFLLGPQNGIRIQESPACDIESLGTELVVFRIEHVTGTQSDRLTGAGTVGSVTGGVRVS